MITIFTSCKPFTGKAAIHQYNAIRSWTLQEGWADIVLFGDEHLVGDIANRLWLRHEPFIERNEYGTPLVNMMFERAQAIAKSDLLCCINADIVLVGNLGQLLQQISVAFPDGFLAMCLRKDVDMDEQIDFRGDWQTRIMSKAGELYTPMSSDLFAFKRPLWEIEPFAFGRPGWDNWMLWNAVQHEMPVVDLTGVITLLHPRHGYGANGTQERKPFWKQPESQANKKLLSERGEVFGLTHVLRAGLLYKAVDIAGTIVL